MNGSRLGDWLSVLGGADLDVLAKARTERSTFINLGLVMLGTASLAALAMMFALRNAVLVEVDPTTGGPADSQPFGALILSIALGLLWGALILVLDRALIKTMQGVVGASALWYALPRLLLACVIGVVVSTPLTLKVFESEITAQVKIDQDAAISQIQAEASNSQVAKDLESTLEAIAEQESILKGDVPGLTSTAVESATTAYETAVAARTEAEEQRDIAYQIMICEKTGDTSNSACEGMASGISGEGPLFQQRKAEYEAAKAKAEEAVAAEANAKAALDSAQDAANEANAVAIENAQRQAEIELCGAAESLGSSSSGEQVAVADPTCSGGLRAAAQVYRDTLESMQDGSFVRESAGLLAQIEALAVLSSESPSAGTAHLFVALLFIIIELLPVVIKTFIAVRGVTQYDRIFRRLQDQEFGKLETITDAEQEGRDRESRKSKEIRDDMLRREIALGKVANGIVASEMEGIVRVALDEWSAQLRSTLKQNPPKAGPQAGTGGPAITNIGVPDGSSL